MTRSLRRIVTIGATAAAATAFVGVSAMSAAALPNPAGSTCSAKLEVDDALCR